MRSTLPRKPGNRNGRGRRAPLAAALVLAATLWLPVRAQDGHGGASTPTPQPAAPAPHAGEARPAPAADPHAPGTSPADTHGGAHGAADTHGDAHGAADTHGDAHGAADTHGDAHGAAHGDAHGDAHGKGEQGWDIHLPTWLYPALREVWYRGPATLSAAGALDASGRQVDAAALTGRQVAYTYHAHGGHGKAFSIRPTLGEIGKATSGNERHEISLDGATYTLLDPKVRFAWQSAFPENLGLSLVTAILVLLGFSALARGMQRVPSRRQMLMETLYGALDTFVGGLLGEGYRKYLPLVGTMFVYIFFMNIGIMIPGWGAATANINVTAGLAVVIVAYVQYEGIRANGFLGYLKHFAGEPWWLAPLNFPIHIIGEAAKLLSLSIRLFGNIFGEDTVIVILILLTGLFTKGIIPAQALMYPLALFAAGVQAMVFSMLTCIYIALMTAHHDEHEGGGDHGHGHGHAHEDHHGPAGAHAHA